MTGMTQSGRESRNPEEDIGFWLMGVFEDWLSRQLEEVVTLEMIERCYMVLGGRREGRRWSVVEI